jgi:branched-chain amino acid transport system permease protein
MAAVATGAIAVVFDGLLLTPLRRAKAPELSSLMVTLGATLLLYSLMTAWFGTDIRRFPPAVFNGGVFEVAGLRISLSQILIVLTVALIVGGLGLLLRSSRIGLAIRALAENDDAAQLMGVNANAIVRLVSFISGALGGAAGVLVGLNYNAIQPYMGEVMMLKGFAVVIMGGLGDIRGAVAAGFILGLLETMTAGYVASSMKDAVGFALLVLTLWFRPVGLFGRAAVKRA